MENVDHRGFFPQGLAVEKCGIVLSTTVIAACCLKLLKEGENGRTFIDIWWPLIVSQEEITKPIGIAN